MKKLVIFLVLFVSISSVFAQRTAYVHRDSVYRSMPEMQAAQTELNDYLTQVQTEIGTMQKEYEQKTKDFNDNMGTYNEAVKNNKVTEIKDLEKRIQDFKVEAQTDYLAKQKKLLVPVQIKFDKAVENVRKKMKYDVVVNIGQDVLYVNPKYIITDEVMAELGIK